MIDAGQDPGPYNAPKPYDTSFAKAKAAGTTTQPAATTQSALPARSAPATKSAPATVKMKAPNGQISDVPLDQVTHYIQMGAKRI
jgi:hypothetical protein